MAKYTDKQRLEAVEAYYKGTEGIRATARSQGLPFESLRTWLAAFRARGAAGIVTRKPGSYSAEFKLEVLRRMKDEGLSCRQAGALFDVRRSNQIAEWSRAYEKYGPKAMQPYWSAMGARISKTLRQHADAEAMPGDDQRSREELLRDLQQLRMENAYLKKVHALVQAKTRSVSKKGR